MYDIIPDIHGQFDKLEHALTAFGYARWGGGSTVIGDAYEQTGGIVNGGDDILTGNP